MEDALCNGEASKQDIREESSRDQSVYSDTIYYIQAKCILCGFMAINIRSKAGEESNLEDTTSQYKECARSTNNEYEDQKMKSHSNKEDGAKKKV